MALQWRAQSLEKKRFVSAAEVSQRGPEPIVSLAPRPPGAAERGATKAEEGSSEPAAGGALRLSAAAKDPFADADNAPARSRPAQLRFPTTRPALSSRGPAFWSRARPTDFCCGGLAWGLEHQPRPLAITERASILRRRFIPIPSNFSEAGDLCVAARSKGNSKVTAVAEAQLPREVGASICGLCAGGSRYLSLATNAGHEDRCFFFIP